MKIFNINPLKKTLLKKLKLMLFPHKIIKKVKKNNWI